jgi:hypothetical protein
MLHVPNPGRQVAFSAFARGNAANRARFRRTCLLRTRASRENQRQCTIWTSLAHSNRYPFAAPNPVSKHFEIVSSPLVN